MKIETTPQLDFHNVLIRPKRTTITSRSEVDLEREFTFVHSTIKWKGVPIIAANMDTVGTFSMAKTLAEQNVLTAIHKHYTLEQWQSFMATCDDKTAHNLMVSTGTSDEDLAKVQKIFGQWPGLKFLCIDVANGYSEAFVDFVKRARSTFPSKVIIAGNVVTGEMVEELILAGADIVKVGIGPGSVCTTRVKTGVGYPQLSAIIECAVSIVS